jgi:hypothetical protein
MRAVDLVCGAVLCALSLALIFIVIPADNPGGRWTGLSPYFFPIVVAGAIAFFSLALSVQAARQTYSAEEKSPPIAWSQLAMLLLAMAVIIAGVIGISRLGVWIGGPLLIAAIMLFMGERSPVFILPTAIIPVLVVHVLVNQFLGSPLP